MTPPNRAVAHHGVLFSAAAWQSLCALRERYQRDPDILSSAERNRLSFFAWLRERGQLVG